MTVKNDNSTEFADEWMIRPCKAYLEEYKDCRSIKARLHQHFISGKSTDCSQWQRDYNSCLNWTSKKDFKAAKSIVESETNRRLDRLRGHYGNTVWEKREHPPEDWNKPLPDDMQEEYEQTWLYKKCKEDEESGSLSEVKESSCVIQ